MAIRLSPEELRAKGTEVQTKGDEFADLTTQTQSLIDGLVDIWEGTAADSFIEQFETLRPSLDAVTTLMNDLKAQLDGTAEIFEQADADISAKFSS